MDSSKRNTIIILGVIGLLILVAVILVFLGVLNSGGSLAEVIEKLKGSDVPTIAEAKQTQVAGAAEVAGVEIYDLSMYEESKPGVC